MSFLITSRSCPHRCSFCSVHQTFGFRYQRRSTEDVLEEIRVRYEEGVRVFDFEDDNLTYYKDEMKELCRRLITLFPARDVQFLAMNGISYLSLDAELLELMKEAGFTHLNLALVSSDLTVRQTTKRPHTIKKYLEVVEKSAALRFHVVSYQILGLPQESLQSMIQTLVFNAKLPVLLGASMFYLTPRSPIAKDLGHEAGEEDIFKSRLTAMAVETGHFSRDDIYTLFVITRMLNFLKGLAAEKAEIDLEEALGMAGRSGGREALGAQLFQKVLEGEPLYAATPKGLRPLQRFNRELFQSIWKQLDFIVTQAGRKMTIK